MLVKGSTICCSLGTSLELQQGVIRWMKQESCYPPPSGWYDPRGVEWRYQGDHEENQTTTTTGNKRANEDLASLVECKCNEHLLHLCLRDTKWHKSLQTSLAHKESSTGPPWMRVPNWPAGNKKLTLLAPTWLSDGSCMRFGIQQPWPMILRQDDIWYIYIYDYIWYIHIIWLYMILVFCFIFCFLYVCAFSLWMMFQAHVQCIFKRDPRVAEFSAGFAGNLDEW